jgi:hypothetical protein
MDEAVAQQVRDLALGLEVPGTEDCVKVIRLEAGPVAKFHREWGFPGPSLGVVAQQAIPGPRLLCLVVGEVRVVGERDDASSEDDDAVEVEPAWQEEAGDVSLLPVEATGREFFLDRALYCNVAQCFNTGPVPNAVLVHVFVNDVPMRAVFTTKSVPEGAAIVFDHATVPWARLFPEPIALGGTDTVVVLDDGDSSAPGAAAAHLRGRFASSFVFFYFHTAVSKK